MSGIIGGLFQRGHINYPIVQSVYAVGVLMCIAMYILIYVQINK